MKTQIQTRIGLAVGLILALLTGLAPRAEAGGYQMPITFGGYTNRTEALTNFPVLVVFSNGVGSSGFSFSSHPFVTTNGYDLRFYTNSADTGDGLAYEIESWNTNAASYVWVRVPLIPTNGSGSIYAKWGDTAASNQLACTTNGAVWANGFSGVYHFRQGSSAPDVRDSSTNAYHGINSNTTSTNSGFVGYAANFPGVNQFITLTNGNKYLPAPNTPISVSTWLKAGTFSPEGRILTIPRVSGSSAFYVAASNTLKVSWNPNTGAGWPSADVSITANTWYHMAVSFNGSQFDCYLNGSRWTNVVSGLTTSSVGSAKAVLGTGPAGDGTLPFKGLLDEFQISSVGRSSNWVWATYANMASNTFFNTYGTAAPVSPYKLQLAFTNYTRAEVLTNFPVLVTFSNGLYGTFNYNTFTAPVTGGDLRFMDSSETSYLDFEIESWDTNGASHAWVRVPQLSSNTTIWAKWGGSDTNLPACTTNGAVWTEGFAGVWHMGATNAAGKLPDSATNTIHGTLGSAASEWAGQIGSGRKFDGTVNGYVDMGDNLDNVIAGANKQFVMESWVRPLVNNMVNNSLFAKSTTTTGDQREFYFRLLTSSKPHFLWYGDGTSSHYKGTLGQTPITDTNSWYHIVAIYDGTNATVNSRVSMFVNGIQEATSIDLTAGSPTSIFNSTAPLTLGAVNNAGTIQTAFNGVLDEMRISQVLRSSNWVWATYANVASNAFFNGYGTVIAPATATAPPQIQNLVPTGVATNGATFNGYLLTNGFESAAVYVAWGQTNGVWTTNWWAAGTWTNGSYPSTNMALSANANYYYRFGATNSTTNVTASGYQYLITGEVTVQPTDPTGRVTLADTAAFTVYRPASCTNEAITVAYTLGGTATNLTHYTNSPAVSGTNGTVTILAGQTNAVITVFPLNLVAPEQSVVLTLVSSNYALGAANSATCTLVQVTGLTYNDKASGNWNVTSTWNPSTGYPGTNDTAVIDSHTVSLVSSLLTGTTAPVSITLDGAGVFQSQDDWATLQVASPITLNGGTIRGAPNNGYSMQFNGPISVTGNGTWDAQYLGYLTMAGAISGTGTVTAAFTSDKNSIITLSSASNTAWTGTLNLTGTVGNGGVGYGFIVRNSQGLGSATVNIGGAAPQPLYFGDPNKGSSMTDVHDYRSIPAPRINVAAKGEVRINNYYNAYSVTVLGVDIALNGGTLAFGADGTGRCGGRLYLTNGVGYVYGYRDNRWNTDNYIDSEIIGTGRLVINAGSEAGRNFHLTGNNTNFSGGITLRYNNLYVRHTNALGSGECWFNATGSGEKVVLTNGTDWALGNNLGGINTIQVENGTASYRLTSRGATIQPGSTNNAAGKLTVDGAYAFAQADGGQCATLRVDVVNAGTVVGTDYDQLRVDHGDATLAASITNCVLAINRTPSPIQMNGLTLTVLSAPGADFTGYEFASVTGLGAGGSMVYSNGGVAVTWVAQTPIINNGAYSNLMATSCDVSGYLSSTGDSPTLVRCYYGTNAVDWGYTNDLSTQSVGTVWTSLTNLTSNVKYYYRFYATNDAGEFWSVATSNFITLGDIYWNDATNGNWKANNANTWGAGANVYPQNVLNDHVTVDSHVVSVDNTLAIVAADVTVTTNAGATGTLSFVNAAAQNQSVILAGGRLGVYSDTAGANDVVLNGNLRVKSASTLDLGAINNRLNTANSTMNGSVMDYGPGTTGVLRVDGSFYSGTFEASGRLVYNGVSTNFTGGWLIQSANAQALDGGFWLGVYQDGGLGASTVTVTRGQLLINATQSGAAPRPAPARVIVNPEGRLLIGSGVTITNWTVDFNGGQMWWYGASKYAGGTLAMNATSTWWGATAGNKEYAGTMSGAGRLDINPTGGSGPFILSGNNSGFSGGIRLLADSLTVSHTNGLGTGPVLLASQSGGKLTLDRAGGNFDWTLANNLSGGCTNGSTAVALQVEDGAGTNTLTVLGTVDPGTNGVAGATNIMGILRVDGDMAFGAGSRLKIDIQGTNGVAGVDFDRLLVDHDLTGLGNATLEVNINTNLAQTSLQGQELVVVSNATALVGTFSTVQWNAPWIGTVRYNDPTGTVKLLNICVAQGSVFRFR